MASDTRTRRGPALRPAVRLKGHGHARPLLRDALPLCLELPLRSGGLRLHGRCELSARVKVEGVGRLQSPAPQALACAPPHDRLSRLLDALLEGSSVSASTGAGGAGERGAQL